MDSTEEAFQRSWKERFPGVEVPKLSCFHEGSVSSIQQCFNETEQRIVTLKEKLQREEFLKHYLWKLHRECLNFDKGGQHPHISLYSPTSDTRTDEEKFELDSPVPVVEIDPFDQKKEGLYKSSSIDKLEPASGRSGSNNSLNDINSKGDALDGNIRAKRDAPVNSRPSLGAWRGKEANTSSDSSTSTTPTVSPGISSFGGIQGSVKDRLTRPGGRFRKDGDSGNSGGVQAKIKKLGGSPLTEKRSTFYGGGQAKQDPVLNTRTPLGKTYSEPGSTLERNTTERLSQRNRPPVPLPRPSVKGPTFKNQSSPGPERKLADRRGSDNSLNSPGGMEGEASSPARLRKQKYHEYCEIEIASASSKDSYDSGGSAEDVRATAGGGDGLDHNLTGSRIRRQALNRERDYVNVTLTTKPKTDTAIQPREGGGGGGPPMLKPRGRVDLCNTDSGSSASVSSKDDEESNRLYDNPNRNTVLQEDDSSSDEDNEPIYFNIMLLKKEALQKASLDSSTIYASIDLEKKGLEREKRRLSQGVLSPYEAQADARPPVPDKALIDDQPVKNHKKNALKCKSIIFLHVNTILNLTSSRVPTAKGKLGKWQRKSLSRNLEILPNHREFSLLKF